MKKSSLLWMALGLCLSACNDDDNPFDVEYPDNGVNQLGTIELRTASETDFLPIAKLNTLHTKQQQRGYINTGIFHFDLDGYLVDAQGFALLTSPVNADGTITAPSLAAMQPLQVQFDQADIQATQTVPVAFNLPASATELDPIDFDYTDEKTYSAATSFPIYDSKGDSYLLSIYLIRASEVFNTWEVRATLSSNGSTNQLDPVADQVLDFNSGGALDLEDQDLDGMTTTQNGMIRYNNFPLSNGAEDLTLSINFAADQTTSLGTDFVVKSAQQDSHVAGRLLSLSIDAKGLITLNYSDNQQKIAGTIGLIKFPSPYSLEYDNGMWLQTEASGEGLAGSPGSGSYGLISAIEYDY